MNRPINLLLLGAVLLGMARCTRDTPMAGGASDIEVSARIVDSLGTPAAHATVRLRRADYVSPVPSLSKTAAFTATNTNTDSDGRFTIRGPEPGAYRIEITDSVSSAVLLACTLAEDAREDLGVDTLRPFAVIAGRVDTTGSAGKQLYVQGDGLERLVTVEPDGSFAVTDLPAGTYDLRSVGADTVVAGVSGVRVDPGQRTSVSMLPGRQFSKRLFLNTTATGADVAENVYAFPLLVRLASDTLSNPGSIPFDFGQARDSGQDLRFSKHDGTQLSYEIEQWDSAGGEAAVWVRVDTVFGNDNRQFITMQWGNPSVPSASDGTAVFSIDDGHVQVFHLGDGARDAAAGHDDVNVTGTRDTLGVVAAASYFDGSDDSIGFSLTHHDTIAVSAWVFARSPGDSLYPSIVQTRSFGIHLGFGEGGNDNNVTFWTSGPDQAGGNWKTPVGGIREKTWYHIAVVYDATSVANDPVVFINGNPVEVSEVRSPPAPGLRDAGRGYIGNNILHRPWHGIIDELRIARTMVPASRVRLSWENQRLNQRLVVF